MTTWRRRTFDAPGLTQFPPGPYVAELARRSSGTARVSSPGYDNIGEVLTAMGITFEAFAGDLDCDLLFINCGTADQFDPGALRDFVTRGGCLYASDLTHDLIDAALPGQFRFDRTSRGVAGVVEARVVDPELRAVMGERTAITFDMSAWTLLDRCEGNTLVEGAPGTPYAGRPLMVEVEIGRGAVFYTSFHNRAQASEQEKVLLQLLVLKQIGASSNVSLAQAGKSVGVALAALQASIRPT